VAQIIVELENLGLGTMVNGALEAEMGCGIGRFRATVPKGIAR